MQISCIVGEGDDNTFDLEELQEKILSLGRLPEEKRESSEHEEEGLGNQERDPYVEEDEEDEEEEEDCGLVGSVEVIAIDGS